MTVVIKRKIAHIYQSIWYHWIKDVTGLVQQYPGVAVSVGGEETSSLRGSCTKVFTACIKQRAGKEMTCSVIRLNEIILNLIFFHCSVYDFSLDTQQAKIA